MSSSYSLSSSTPNNRNPFERHSPSPYPPERKRQKLVNQPEQVGKSRLLLKVPIEYVPPEFHYQAPEPSEQSSRKRVFTEEQLEADRKLRKMKESMNPPPKPALRDIVREQASAVDIVRRTKEKRRKEEIRRTFDYKKVGSDIDCRQRLLTSGQIDHDLWVEEIKLYFELKLKHEAAPDFKQVEGIPLGDWSDPKWEGHRQSKSREESELYVKNMSLKAEMSEQREMMKQLEQDKHDLEKKLKKEQEKTKLQAEENQNMKKKMEFLEGENLKNLEIQQKMDLVMKENQEFKEKAVEQESLLALMGCLSDINNDLKKSVETNEKKMKLPEEGKQQIIGKQQARIDTVMKENQKLKKESAQHQDNLKMMESLAEIIKDLEKSVEEHQKEIKLLENANKNMKKRLEEAREKKDRQKEKTKKEMERRMETQRMLSHLMDKVEPQLLTNRKNLTEYQEKMGLLKEENKALEHELVKQQKTMKKKRKALGEENDDEQKDDGARNGQRNSSMQQKNGFDSDDEEKRKDREDVWAALELKQEEIEDEYLENHEENYGQCIENVPGMAREPVILSSDDEKEEEDEHDGDTSGSGEYDESNYEKREGSGDEDDYDADGYCLEDVDPSPHGDESKTSDDDDREDGELTDSSKEDNEKEEGELTDSDDDY